MVWNRGAQRKPLRSCLRSNRRRAASQTPARKASVFAAVTRRVSRSLRLVEGGGATPKGGGALCVMLAAAECRQKLSAFLLWANMWRTSMHLIFFCCSVLVPAMAQHCHFPATPPWSSGQGGGGARDAEAGEEQVRAGRLLRGPKAT